MSRNSEHEDKEHVIDEETSWDDMVKRLGTGEGSAEKAAAKDSAEEEGKDAAEESGSVVEAPAEGASEREIRSEEGSGRAEEEPAAPEESARAADGGDSHAGRKSMKRSRKELAALLKEEIEARERLQKEAEAARQELVAKGDKLIRVVAEFENYKKRTRREWELHQKRANAELIKDLLGVMDDLERALEASGDAGGQFKQGVQLIYSGLLDVLRRSGLKEIEALNVDFDPQYHEALGEMKSGDVPEGRVLQVVQKGYLLHDQLLRPAKVIVARSKES